MLVQFAFFSSYCVFALPAGKLIDAIDTSKNMVGGLPTAGAFLLYRW